MEMRAKWKWMKLKIVENEVCERERGNLAFIKREFWLDIGHWISIFISSPWMSQGDKLQSILKLPMFGLWFPTCGTSLLRPRIQILKLELSWLHTCDTWPTYSACVSSMGLWASIHSVSSRVKVCWAWASTRFWAEWHAEYDNGLLNRNFARPASIECMGRVWF